MKKITSLLFLIVGIVSFSYGQDTIIFKGNKKNDTVFCKIYKVTTSTISYTVNSEYKYRRFQDVVYYSGEMEPEVVDKQPEYNKSVTKKDEVTTQKEKTLLLTFKIKDLDWELIRDTVVEGKFYSQGGEVFDVSGQTPFSDILGKKSFKIKQHSKNGATLISNVISDPYEKIFDENGNKKDSIIYVAKLPYKPLAVTIEVFDGSKKIGEYFLTKETK